MNSFIAWIITGSIGLASYGFYDAYSKGDCPRGIQHSKKELIQTPQGLAHIKIEYCK